MERKLARMAGAAHGVVTRRQLLAGRRHPRGDQLASRDRRAASRVPRRLSRRAPGAERGGQVPGRNVGVRQEGAPEWEGCRASARAGPRAPAAARGHRPVRAPRAGRTNPAHASVRGDALEGDPGDDGRSDACGLAAVLTPDELARACHEAGVRHRATPGDVEAVLGRYPNAPGAGDLRRVLRGDVNVTLSKLESRFLQQLEELRLPLARPPPDHRARRLPLPPLPPRLGAGPPLHLRRRPRAPDAHAQRATSPACRPCHRFRQ